VVAESTVTSGDANASMLDASGYVVARRQATVAAKTTGKVTEVLIDEGQRVSKDQVIARLDDTNAQAALAQAKAQLAQSQANLEAARVAFANAEPIFVRYRRQLDKGVISAQDYDTAKSSYDASKSNLSVTERSVGVAQATLAVAQRNVDDMIVRAPFAGVITVKAAQPGEMISPMSAGGFTRTGIGTIVDMDSLEVEVDVSENFINRVRPEQPASIKLNAYPDWLIPGEVIAVIPTADRSKATVKVRVGFKVKDPRILPEMGARVSFLNGDVSAAHATLSARPSVQIPATAVKIQGEQGVVFIVHDNTVERRVVKLGARTGDEQTVVAGVVPGDKLVVGDLDTLVDGAKVQIAK
jgi:RND family efflux transporter MFP subunit